MSSVTLRKSQGVGHLELNRPDAANALNLEMARLLVELVTSAGEDDDITAVLVTGAGARFCGGGDVVAMAAQSDPTAYVQELADTVDAALRQLSDLSKPVVCAVHGAVAGAGIAVMLSCDVIMAAPGTTFGMAYSKVGLTPDCGTSWLLPRAIGLQRALNLGLTGRALSAEEAADWGLVSEVVTEPAAAARRLAAEMAAGPAQALGQTRRLLRSSYTRDRAAAGVDESRTIASSVTTEFAQQALLKFGTTRKSSPPR